MSEDKSETPLTELLKYAQHGVNCSWHRSSSDDSCTCGFRDLLRELAPLPSSEGTVKSHMRDELIELLKAAAHELKEGMVMASYITTVQVVKELEGAIGEFASVPLKSETVPTEQLVIDLARELYDRFVMGGWQPQDAYGMIREMLAIPFETVPTEAAKPPKEKMLDLLYEASHNLRLAAAEAYACGEPKVEHQALQLSSAIDVLKIRTESLKS